MITLPNGCSCSELSIFPKNWNTPNGNTSIDWRIQYYFYDPRFKEEPKFKYGKLCIVKGMNRYKSRQDRCQATKELLAAELRLLKEEQYNPITKIKVTPSEHNELEPSTPFVSALYLAASKMRCAANTKLDVKSVLKYIEIAAKALYYDTIVS
jgi:hypothetical protein